MQVRLLPVSHMTNSEHAIIMAAARKLSEQATKDAARAAKPCGCGDCWACEVYIPATIFLNSKPLF